MKANFFWHGSSLSVYECAAIGSFLHHNFPGRVYSFDNNLCVPRGVELCDAGQFANESEVYKYTHGGQTGSIAAFADIFRYRLLSHEPGWWFDTDVICLRDVEEFKKLERKTSSILAGRENRHSIANGVLYIAETSVARHLLTEASAMGDIIDWGAMGPNLLTRAMHNKFANAVIMPPKAFYPIDYQNISSLFQPEQLAKCRKRARNSYCVHMWNEIIERMKLPKSLGPCQGSYLHKLFVEIGAVTPATSCLTLESFNARNLHYRLKSGAGRVEQKKRGPYQRIKRMLKGNS